MKSQKHIILAALLIPILFVAHIEAASAGKFLSKTLPTLLLTGALFSAANSLTPSSSYIGSSYPFSMPAPIYSNPFFPNPYLAGIDAVNAQFRGGWGGMNGMYNYGYGMGGMGGMGGFFGPPSWSQMGMMNPWGAPYTYGMNGYGNGYGYGYGTGNPYMPPLPQPVIGNPLTSNGVGGLNTVPLSTSTTGQALSSPGNTGAPSLRNFNSTGTNVNSSSSRVRH